MHRSGSTFRADCGTGGRGLVSRARRRTRGVPTCLPEVRPRVLFVRVRRRCGGARCRMRGTIGDQSVDQSRVPVSLTRLLDDAGGDLSRRRAERADRVVFACSLDANPAPSRASISRRWLRRTIPRDCSPHSRQSTPIVRLSFVAPEFVAGANKWHTSAGCFEWPIVQSRNRLVNLGSAGRTMECSRPHAIYATQFRQTRSPLYTTPAADPRRAPAPIGIERQP